MNTMDSVELEVLPEALRAEVTSLATSYPPAIPVLKHLVHLLFLNSPSPAPSSEQPAKKRKLDALEPASDDLHLHTIHDLSFISPARKKFSLRIHKNTFHLISPKDLGQTEASYLWKDIIYAFCVPTPNRAKPHWTICLMPAGEKDAIIFGFDDKSSNMKITDGATGEVTVLDKKESCKAHILQLLQKGTKRELVEPSARIFQARSRKGELHIDCYLKAREGQLFFLRTGILFGLRKPLLFFPFSDIAGLDIVSPTGRNFGLFLQRTPAEDDSETRSSPSSENYEFAMIDSAEAESVLLYIETYKNRFGEGSQTRNGANEESKPGSEDSQPEEAIDELEEEEDEDFMPSDEDEVAEEYDSDHNTDGEASSFAGSGDEEEEEWEDGSDENEKTIIPRNTLLSKPGAVPRLSHNAIDAVVGAVEEAFGIKQEADDDDQFDDDNKDGDDDDKEADESQGDESENDSPAGPRGMAALAAQIERERAERIGLPHGKLPLKRE
ncbi:uncharacterized protein SPPG_08185 [Spizellomyces punctatus DAOM BR117]|uniref:Histone chaperone RTT106/FACT complex subunit SPT16-like middle domain-containing protein n=1 Tax=Spizellomyces punctatus (strain DAOM BR117) TaxID=645134 RepID=A0A0L0H6V6_SPIPD|nr:uncharacterized protein SPPG_08185 [Spizellomyces punctatus DAOM BR117]KNC96601.1 hypothetical protein SPPG_08185 [Spizellomyces punctatus DAOM BR117]|eukprot:XP_016604641.1 hypothetical protein SPPG_08185 [Spizellomyces punctatus DAOM BR117]